MNSSKIIFAVALIAFSCITYSQSLKCYVCNSKDTCRSAKKQECNYVQANTTRAFLDFHHYGVIMNQTSNNLDCYREEIKSPVGEFYYKGCIYNNMQGCTYVLKDLHTSGKHTRNCNQCNDKDGCNPAGRVATDVLAVCTTIAVGLVGRHLWS